MIRFGRALAQSQNGQRVVGADGERVRRCCRRFTAMRIPEEGAMKVLLIAATVALLTVACGSSKEASPAQTQLPRQL